MPDKPNIIIDSGAYSTWKGGGEVDLVGYCDWLIANKDWIGPYVALDVIGPKDPEAAALGGIKNLEYMLGRGLDPIPVFHAGEDIKYLHRMLDMGCKYIGLAASMLPSRPESDAWYDYAWSHLVDRHGDPVVKVHAFGEGRPHCVVRYPWQSADSATWLYAAQRNAIIWVSLFDRVGVMQRNDGKGHGHLKDVHSLNDRDRAVFDDHLRAVGINPELMRALETGKQGFLIRTYLAAIPYLAMQKIVRERQPIRRRAGGLFAPPASRQAIALDPFNMHLVIGNNTASYVVLAELEHMNALSSYYYIAGTKTVGHHSVLRDYCINPKQACMSHPKLAQLWDDLQNTLLKNMV